MMVKVEEQMLRPEFSYEKTHLACKAATGIFKWIKQTRDYFYVFKEIEPRRDAFMLAQREYENQAESLQIQNDNIEQLDSALNTLKEHQRAKDQIILQLRNEIRDCLVRKNRADTLIRRINSEKHKWVVCIRMLNAKEKSLRADVLLAAAFMSFLSGFPQKERQECVKIWA